MSDEQEKPTALEHTPPVLDYVSGAGKNSKQTGGSGQVLAGFLCWVLILIAVCVITPATSAILPPNFLWVVPGIGLGVVLWISIWVRVQWRWRGFIPGVLLGLGLTCLVPIGIAAVVCGPLGRL